MSEVKYKNWIQSDDIHGPQPHIVGNFLIIEYLGCEINEALQRKKRQVYLVRCLRCGRQFKRFQTSIKKGSKSGCLHCSKNKREAQKQEAARRKYKEMLDSRNTFISIMQTWPVCPPELRPGRLFDSEWIRYYSRLT